MPQNAHHERRQPDSRRRDDPRTPPGTAGCLRRSFNRALAAQPAAANGSHLPGGCGKIPDLTAFWESLAGLGPATRNRILSSVRSLLAFAHRIGYLPFDVGRPFRMKAVRNELAERILPEADVHRMLNLEPDRRNRALLTLLYASGIRVQELCDLEWNHLQAQGEDEGQVTVFGKGGKTRSVQLPASVWKPLLQLRPKGKASGPVFVSRKKRGRGFATGGRHGTGYYSASLQELRSHNQQSFASAKRIRELVAEVSQVVEDGDRHMGEMNTTIPAAAGHKSTRPDKHPPVPD
jgi:integrase